MQRCSDCDEVKPLDEFHRDPSKATGRRVKCKQCVNAYGRKRYQANREDILAELKERRAEPERSRRIAEYAREYNAAHSARLKAQRKADREANPEKYRLIYLKRYGLTAADYDGFLNEQDGRCAICRQLPDKKLCIDHDHSCCPGPRSCGACVRGLLCSPCNHMLGQARDSAETLRAGADYLEKWEAGRMYDATGGVEDGPEEAHG